MDIAVNYLAVLAAGVVSMILGALWYSPALFGKQWMKAIGFSNEDIERAKEKGMGKTYAMNFIAVLVMAFVLAQFVSLWGVVGTAGAFQLTFWIWLGFMAPLMLGTILWENKPWTLFFINAGYYLVSVFIMALILVYWV